MIEKCGISANPEYPASKFAEKALFGMGEIYFSMANYRDTNKSFIEHVKFYPNSDARLFSLVYLLKLAKISKNKSLVEGLEKKILSFYQLSFLFRDFKEYEYRSPSLKVYKAVYYIDKVEFSIDGDKFEKISY